MSQKQTDHRNHYVSSLAELPEDETLPSNVTPIEELGISLLDEEAKTLDSDEEGDEDEQTPSELKAMFFSLIAELQRKFPEYTATDFKQYLEEDVDMAEELLLLKNNFHKTFKDVDKSDPEYINLLIGLSSIGIQIPKDEGEDEGEDKGEDEGDENEGDEDEGDKVPEDEANLTKSIIAIDLENEPETDV